MNLKILKEKVTDSYDHYKKLNSSGEERTTVDNPYKNDINENNGNFLKMIKFSDYEIISGQLDDLPDHIIENEDSESNDENIEFRHEQTDSVDVDENQIVQTIGSSK